MRAEVRFLTGAMVVMCAVGCGAGPSVDWENIDSVEIKVVKYDDRDGSRAQTISSSDSEKIKSLLAVLRSASGTHDHKCANAGEIMLVRKNGTKNRIGILPGHKQAYYEFRFYKEDGKHEVFRADREGFVRVMKDLGVSELELTAP